MYACMSVGLYRYIYISQISVNKPSHSSSSCKSNVFISLQHAVKITTRNSIPAARTKGNKLEGTAKTILL